MCGLVGMMVVGTASDNELNLFKGLLLVDQIRGSHATGVIKVKTRDNTVTMHKRALDAVDFLADADTKKFLGEDKAQIYIGHNRYATVGDKSADANAHPFQHEHITMVHNGGVDQRAMYDLEGYQDKDVVVDSHMVCMTIAKHGIKEAVTKYLAGAFALVWWDSKERSLNFIRNNERPLYLALTTGGALVWASENGMLDVYLKREGRVSGYRMEPTLMDADKHLKFKFDATGNRVGNVPTATDMEFKEVEYYPKWNDRHADASWWSDNTSVGARSQGSSKASDAGKQSARTYSADLDRSRVKENLTKAGYPSLSLGSFLTVDIVSVIPYGSNPGFCTVNGIARESGAEVQFWGIQQDTIEGITVVRGEISNAYSVIINGNSEFTISMVNPGISCHDPKYNYKNIVTIGTLAKPVGKNLTSHGESKTAKEVAAEVVESGKSKRQLRAVIGVTYPLKAHGHTFNTPEEFREFVQRGCSGCGQSPAAYNIANKDLTVYEGPNFKGLLDDCEFMCGKCSK